METDQQSQNMTYSLVELLELLSSFTDRVAFGIDHRGKLLAASQNALSKLGLYPASVIGKEWSEIIFPLDMLPWRHLNRQGDSTGHLYCWLSPLKACEVNFSELPSLNGVSIVLLDQVKSDKLQNALSRTLGQLNEFLFPVCLTFVGTKIRYHNQALEDVLDTENNTLDTHLIFDRLHSFPKNWTIESALAKDGKYTFETKLNEKTGFRDLDCLVEIREIKSFSGETVWLWVILPAIMNDLVDQYVDGATETPIEDLIERINFSVKTLYELGVDIVAAQNSKMNISATSRRTFMAASYEVMSERQSEILFLLSEGLKYEEIAAQLHLKMPTVKTHIANLYHKLSVRNKAEALMLAEQNGWLTRLRHHHGN